MRERERERTRVLLPWAWRTWGGSEKRGARVFRVWLWLDLYTNSEEENGKKLKGDFVNSRKKWSMGLYAWQQGYNTECGLMKPVIVVLGPITYKEQGTICWLVEDSIKAHSSNKLPHTCWMNGSFLVRAMVLQSIIRE